jgi:3-methylfumaryl-CoA hydratase
MMDFDSLRAWIGRSETRADRATAMPIAALAATLDRDDPAPATGSEVPPLWHWLYFTPLTRASELGHDGHARLGGFLPPVPLPRRMWAGGRLEFAHPLRIGDEMTRSSRIAEVSGKSGRSGALVFVTVQHAIANAFGIALREEHDIVYREAPRTDAPLQPPQAAPRDEAFGREIVPDPVLLFRYSALTFNGHRIHYDRSYVTEVEGYPGLIVHGPLLATLLLDLVRRNAPAAEVATFQFRAVRPTFDLHPFRVNGEPRSDGSVHLWAQDHEGFLTMDATATLRQGA